MNYFTEPQGTCPICRSADISKSEKNNKQFTDNFYLEIVRRELEISEDELNEQTPVYQCNTCHTIFCDPWFTYEFASRIYNTIYPQHNGGWEALYGWLGDQPKHEYSQLLEDIIIQVGPVNSYAEYNCPFHGNLMSFRSPELKEVSKEKLYRSCVNYLNSRQQSLDSSKSKDKYQKMRIHSDRCVSELNDLLKKVTHGERKRYLIHEASSFCWDFNCTAEGVSCKSLASKLLDVHCLAVQEALNQKLEVDVLGVFNILDHVPDPMQTLERLLKISRYVLLVNHYQEVISKQHRFVLRPGFLNYLQDQGYKITELDKRSAKIKSTEAEENKLMCLISR